MSLFKRAVKRDAKLRLAIVGPSGSGKTYTALAIGTALANGGGVAVVDTENGSASKYADLFNFDVAEMHAPFKIEKYIRTIQEADEAGYSVLILDSLSHGWSGSGGLLDYVDEQAKRIKGNSFAAWKEGTPLHNQLVDTIIQSNIHVIGTMRAKTEYIMVEGRNGKTQPKKVGMGAIQRDGLEYEFDVVFEMDIDNNAIVTKTRCPALTGRAISKPGGTIAATLREWLQGTSVDDTPQPHPNGAQRAPEPPTESEPNDNPFEEPNADEDGNGLPTLAELDVTPEEADWLQDHPSPPAAQNWAEENGYCDNQYEARNSWKKVVDGHALTPGEPLQVAMILFRRRQLEKAAQEKGE